MLKAVRLCLNQQMPNYRKPASFLIRESLPLPPYSSVIGMVHAACGFTEYHPMQISVQGTSAGTVSDLATMYNFGIKYDPDRHWGKVENTTGGFDGINRGVKSCELLTDVQLVLHIVPDDEALVQQIYDALNNPPMYLSLGRYEDLIQTETLDIVELRPVDSGEVTAVYDMYVPVLALEPAFNKNLVGTVYKINKVFAPNNPKKLRTWEESVTVRHVCKDAHLNSFDALEDCTYGEPVFPA